jgi:ubiquinone/menaquinone biosynthesis C-methylase UbiE
MTRLYLFALLAPLYDRIFTAVNLDRLQKLLELPVSPRMLDVGGGTGRVSAMLPDTIRQIVVTDPSAPMLRQVKRKRGLQPVCAQAERLPFPDRSFHRVLVVDAFHHFHDHGRAASELLRVLTPGGRLVVEEPNIERWSVKVVAMGERLAMMRSRFLQPKDMRRIFETRGGHVTIYTDEGINAWLVVEKPPSL